MRVLDAPFPLEAGVEPGPEQPISPVVESVGLAGDAAEEPELVTRQLVPEAEASEAESDRLAPATVMNASTIVAALL